MIFRIHVESVVIIARVRKKHFEFQANLDNINPLLQNENGKELGM